MNIATSKVSKKGLTSIPAKVRKTLGIEEGDILIWEIDEKHSKATVRIAKDPIKHLKGKYSDANLIYEQVEELADKLIARETHANN